MLTFFPIQTFVNSNRCNMTPSNAKGQSHVSRNETRSLCNSRRRRNYVTERSHKDKKIIIIITPHKESLGRLCSVLQNIFKVTYFDDHS